MIVSEFEIQASKMPCQANCAKVNDAPSSLVDGYNKISSLLNVYKLDLKNVLVCSLLVYVAAVYFGFDLSIFLILVLAIIMLFMIFMMSKTFSCIRNKSMDPATKQTILNDLEDSESDDDDTYTLNSQSPRSTDGSVSDSDMSDSSESSGYSSQSLQSSTSSMQSTDSSRSTRSSASSRSSSSYVSVKSEKY